MLHRLRLLLSDLLHRRRFERDIDDELRAFVDLEAADRQRHGATPAEARRAALSGLGSLESTKERLRELRSGARLHSFMQDVRLSLRMLRGQPAFAAAAILTIGLGIGPLTTVLSLAAGLFYRPVPGVPDSASLVEIDARLSYLNRADLAGNLRNMTGLAGFSRRTSLSVATQDAEARQAYAVQVTHDYFQVLGMPMAAGRPFRPDEDRVPQGAPVAILSHSLSRALFADSAFAPGRQLLINGLPFTVIGVAAEGFDGTVPGEPVDLWITGSTTGYVLRLPPERWTEPRFSYFVGRLAPGVSLDEARAELTSAVSALADADPDENERLHDAPVRMVRGLGFPPGDREDVALLVTLLASAGALLLLLAAANVANLMLFRAARRYEETRMRQALGATRWRLVRASLTDSCVISLIAGATGVLFAIWCVRLAAATLFASTPFVDIGSFFTIDWRVTALAFAAAALVGLVFGGLPALAVSFRDRVPAASSRTAAGGRLRTALTAAQLALSLSLLIGALLLLASIRNQHVADLGFDRSGVVTAEVNLGSHGYDDSRMLAYHRQLLEGASAAPGVETVSVSNSSPLDLPVSVRPYLPGADPEKAPYVHQNTVTAGYFHLLGIPIVRGRNFNAAESLAAADGSCGPVLVSESLATTYFGSEEAVGRTLILPKNINHPMLECSIVGVVGDVGSANPNRTTRPALYLSYGRTAGSSPTATILAKTNLPLPEASAALEKVAASIDPAIPLFNEVSFDQLFEMQMMQERIVSSLLTLLSLIGILMAAVGLHGLVAEAVIRRTREFGIRMALGADARGILMTVFRDALRLAAFGITAGLALATALSHALRSQLYGVDDVELGVYLGAAVLLTTVILVASIVPAIRAARVNPVDALRAE